MTGRLEGAAAAALASPKLFLWLRMIPFLQTFELLADFLGIILSAPSNKLTMDAYYYIGPVPSYARPSFLPDYIEFYRDLPPICND